MVSERDGHVSSLPSIRIAEKLPHLPVVDIDGTVRADGQEVRLPPAEARLLRLLLDRYGRAVRREDLRAAGWPGQEVGDRAVDGRITGMRRRIAPLGLSIATVRGVGYLLERTQSG